MERLDRIRQISSRASLQLIGIAPEEISKSIVPILSDCCSVSDSDGACLFHLSDDRNVFFVSQFWRDDKRTQMHFPRQIFLRDVPGLAEALSTGEPYELSDSASSAKPFPAEAEVYERAGVRALLAVPLKAASGPVAGLLLVNRRTAGRWTEEAWTTLDEFGALFGRLVHRLHPLTKRIQELRELVGGDTEAVFHAVIDSLNQGVSCCCVDGLVVYCNPAWERITGYSLDETKGRRIYEFLFPADTAGFERLKYRQHERYEERRKGIAEEYETQIIRKDGNKRWIQVKASPLRNQDFEVVGSIGIVTDITEQKLLQDQMLCSENSAAIANAS